MPRPPLNKRHDRGSTKPTTTPSLPSKSVSFFPSKLRELFVQFSSAFCGTPVSYASRASDDLKHKVIFRRHPPSRPLFATVPHHDL